MIDGINVDRDNALFLIAKDICMIVPILMGIFDIVFDMKGSFFI